MIRPWLIAACLLAAVARQPPTPATDSQPAGSQAASGSDQAKIEELRFERRLEAVDTAMAKVVDLRSDFEQRRHTPLLKKPMISKGVVRAKRGRVRWDTTTPRASTLLVGDGAIRMYYPADNLLEVYPVTEGFKDLAGAPLPPLSTLRAQFEFSPLLPKELGAGVEDAKLLAVKLTPKSDGLRKHVAWVKVLIDESKPAATKVVMTDPDGEETEIVFSNVKVNDGVKDEEIELRLPEGVRISKPLGEGKDGGTGAAPRVPEEKR